MTTRVSLCSTRICGSNLPLLPFQTPSTTLWVSFRGQSRDNHATMRWDNSQSCPSLTRNGVVEIVGEGSVGSPNFPSI